MNLNLRHRFRPGVERLEARNQPATLAAPDLLSHFDTGESMFDNLTNAAQPVFAGTTSSPAGSIITLLVDGQPAGSHVVSRGGGESFLIGVSTPLAHGAHVVRFLDSSTLSTSASLSVTVDRTPPATPIAPTLVDADDRAALVIQLKGTAGDRLRVVVNGQTVHTLSATGGTQSTTLDVSSITGPISIAVVAEDRAGNVSGPSPALQLAAAAVPQPPTIWGLDPASDDGLFDDDGVTTQTTLTFRGSAVAGQTITLHIDGVAVASQVVGVDGIFALTAGPLTTGPHQAWLTATDVHGTVSSPTVVRPIDIDQTPPEITNLSLVPTDLSPNGDGVHDRGDLRFELSEPAFVVAHFLDAQGVNLGAIPLDILDAGEHQFDLDVPNFGAGDYSFVLIASDLADNLADLVSVPFAIDLTPPTTPTLALAPGDDTGSSNSDGVTSALGPAFVGTAEPGSVVELAASGVSLGTATVAGDGTWSLPTNMGVGTHIVTATTRDAAGNVSTAATFTLVIDPDADVDPNAAPTLSLPPVQSAFRNGSVLAGSAFAVADADSDQLKVDVSIDHGTILSAAAAGVAIVGDGTPTVSLHGPIAAVNSALAGLSFRLTTGYVGAAIVSIHVDDLDGATADASVRYDVVNRLPAIGTPPTFTMSSNTTLNVPATTGLAKSFTDLDGDTLAITILTPPSVGALVVNADGSFHYTPPPNFAGLIAFTVRASDGLAFSSPLTVTIDVRLQGIRRN